MSELDSQVKQRICSLSDKELIKMLTSNPDEYIPESRAFAKGEAQRRGLKDISVDAIEHMEQQEAQQVAQPSPSIPEKALSQAMHLYRIGKDQKMLQWLCLATLATNVLAPCGIHIFALGGPLQAVPGIIFIAGLVYYVKLAVAVRCTSALVCGVVLLLSFVVCFIPSFDLLGRSVGFTLFLGLMTLMTLIMLAVVLRRATNILREAGLKVGIMGARTSQLKSLREARQSSRSK